MRILGNMHSCTAQFVYLSSFCLSFSLSRAMYRGNNTCTVIVLFLHWTVLSLYICLKHATSLMSCHLFFFVRTPPPPRNCMHLLIAFFFLTWDTNMKTYVFCSIYFIKTHLYRHKSLISWRNCKLNFASPLLIFTSMRTYV